MAPLPLFKLGTLVVKQLAKPLANGIKRVVKEHPRGANIIARPAQIFHAMEQRVRMAGFGFTERVQVKPLEHDRAVALGAEMVGEMVVFSVAVVILCLELLRSKAGDKRKERVQNEKLVSLQEQIVESNTRLSALHSEVHELKNIVHRLVEKRKHQSNSS